MNARDYLLVILAEECTEVAHRASKAIRFGVDEVQSGQELTNAERIMEEMADLMAVYAQLVMNHGFPSVDPVLIQAKHEKIRFYMQYSKDVGTLTEG